MAKKTQTPNAGQYKPGQSGNPAGRPRKGETLAEAVRLKWPADKLVELMTKHAESANDAVSMRAGEWLAERGYGPAPKQVDISVSSDAAPVDWGALPLERRQELLAALEAADEIALPGDDGAPGDH